MFHPIIDYRRCSTFCPNTIRETNAAKTVSKSVSSQVTRSRYLTLYYRIHTYDATFGWHILWKFISINTKVTFHFDLDQIVKWPIVNDSPFSRVLIVLWKPTYLISPVENIFRPALKLAILIQELLNPMLADMICILFRIFPRQRWSFGQQPHGWIPTLATLRNVPSALLRLQMAAVRVQLRLNRNLMWKWVSFQQAMS